MNTQNSSKTARVSRPPRTQVEMFFFSLEQLLPADHRVRSVWTLVQMLNLESLYAVIEIIDNSSPFDSQPRSERRLCRSAKEPEMKLPMKLYARLMLFFLISTVGVVTTGCDGRPKRVPIAGTVLIDGKPLTKGNITVIPANARAARAMIDSQGRFRLSTFDENDGAVLGEHPVAIVSTENVGGNGLRWLVPKKYKDTTSSGLTIKVEQPTQDLRIELTWDGGAPFVELMETGGDVGPVGAVPVEPVPEPSDP